MKPYQHSFQPLVTQLEILIDQLPKSEYPQLIGDLSRLQAIATLALTRESGLQEQSPVPLIKELPGLYLTVSEVCKKYRVTKKWLYTHKNELPHIQPSRKVLLFPERKLVKWFANKT